MLYKEDERGRLSGFNLMGDDGNIIATSRRTEASERWHLYNKDVRGSTPSLLDSTGAAAAAYLYDDFGETTATVGEDFDNEVCYTGQVCDRNTGLYYYNARFYEPENGRFVSQDTYRGESNEPKTLHLYAYCANNPVNYVDPSGHKKYRKMFKVVYGKKGDITYSYFYSKIKVDISKKKIKSGNVTDKYYKNVWYQQPVHGRKDPLYYKKGKKKDYWYARIAWGVVCGAQGGGISYYKVLDITVKSNCKYECFKATVPAGAYPIAWGNQKKYSETYGSKTYESGTLK